MKSSLILENESFEFSFYLPCEHPTAKICWLGEQLQLPSTHSDRTYGQVFPQFGPKYPTVQAMKYEII